ncbi:MAG: COR domain-containing protein [Methanosarcina sp.]|uniref:leucine-rich repeat domain-containing protein n=1 Tax=Methanosarcina sp. TaxID=2213 RepID=UPI0026329053|nr:COR domain-containing protein [Methanosarcina sp.]MDD3247590.1 COR domain-containing protein [Methanosarcina sp.]
MESNKIKDLIREVQRSKATVLDLSSINLTSLPPEVSELKNLTLLFMDNSQLTSLPPEIFELKNLTELYIHNNQLTSLPPEISELKNLTELYISGNQLTSLPPEISELKNLIQLDISGNQLTSLPPEISKLKNLTQLNISKNHLRSLPPEIFELKNLTQLDMSKNHLRSLPPEISELKNLTKLYIFDNQLTSLPSEISKLKNLTKLDIFGNQLTSLPPEISELKNLTELDISANQLTSLPPEILELGLEIEWEGSWKSNIIFVKENPFENPPVEIVRQGREAIVNYFKSLEGEKRPLNEVKVLLVGDGGAGKTSLVKRIFGEEVDGNEPQTQGINIRMWVVENGEREIKANFWDFGGQEIMHATHQFFLSKRSFYILVLDGRKDEKPEYWLKLIENFGGNSPVLVVINKIDENPAFELNRKFLQEKYPSIGDKGFYRLSCKSNEGVEEFSKALQEELTKVKHLEIKWPKSWFNVKSRLEKICPNCSSNIKGEDACEYFNFIEYKEYKQTCDEEGIKSESEQNTLVDFLHDLGVVLHFKDIPLLNTHVLEPEWVTNAVYKLVNSKEIAESKGVLKLDMFAEILKQRTERDFSYPPDQYGFFISLMKKFELSYDLDDSTVLLPGLLEIQEPDFEFDYEGTLRFIIDYDFLPPSVMPRFIVKMNRDIKDDLRWRTGVVLEDKGFKSTAVIKSDNEAKRISIYVNGRQRRDYFSVILQRFREINNNFEKLKAIEKIPLPDEPEVTVGYEHLIKLELRGIDTYMPDGSDNEYKVSELLGTVINGNGLMEILKEILQKTEMNEREILKILQNIQKIESESEVEDSLLEKINRIITLNPNVFGVGPNINEMINLYLERKKRRS